MFIPQYTHHSWVWATVDSSLVFHVSVREQSVEPSQLLPRVFISRKLDSGTGAGFLSLFSFSLCCFCCSLRTICLYEKQRARESEGFIYHPLVHSLIVHSSHMLARLKPGSWNTQVSHVRQHWCSWVIISGLPRYVRKKQDWKQDILDLNRPSDTVPRHWPEDSGF